MKRYTVELTDTAMDAIHAQLRFIAIEQRQPPHAERWLAMVWDAVDSLETFPHGQPLATENEDVPYEVRFVLAGHESLLFTIEEDQQLVRIIAMRGQGQLPISDDLPPL